MKVLSVYLDSNVLIDMCDGERQQLKNNVLALSNQKLSFFPFSASHVSELSTYPMSSRCSDRLNFLSELSKNLYLVHNIEEYCIKIESPFTIYETINQEFHNLNENKLFAEVIPHEALVYFRNQLNLSTIELNNLSGSDVVGAINDAMKRNIPPNVKGPRSIEEMLDFCKNLKKVHFEKQYTSLGTTLEHMSHRDELQFIFMMLDIYGYWPDNKSVYEKGSRFADQLHVFNASHFELFVTNDKGMKHRAEAAFSILGMKTEVKFTHEYEELIS
jgi:hypothetical protein